MTTNACAKGEQSVRLKNLAQQLLLHENHHLHAFSEREEKEEDGGKVISQAGVGSNESEARPIANRNRSKNAAVLICLFEDDGGRIRVVLTKRSPRMSSHSGEVSLPGGVADEGDANAVDIALREAKEEVGLDPSLVNIVAILEPFLSKSLLRVTPVIGILSDKKSFKPVLNPSEVAAIFDAPLEMFLKEENWNAKEMQYPTHKYLLHSFDFQYKNENFRIWGLTAQILIHVASIVYQRLPNFVKQMPNFQVAKFITQEKLTPRM